MTKELLQNAMEQIAKKCHELIDDKLTRLKIWDYEMKKLKDPTNWDCSIPPTNRFKKVRERIQALEKQIEEIEEIEKITEGKYTPASNWDNNVR